LDSYRRRKDHGNRSKDYNHPVFDFDPDVSADVRMEEGGVDETERDASETANNCNDLV
jgi:hypothetical protein